MTARDDYPTLAKLIGDRPRNVPAGVRISGAFAEAQDALDEIDRLRAEVDYRELGICESCARAINRHRLVTTPDDLSNGKVDR